MNKIFIIWIVTCCVCWQQLQAQSTFIPLGDNEYHLADRLETISGQLSDSLFMSTQPLSREFAVPYFLQQSTSERLTSVDRSNLARAISISGEWTPDGNGAVDSKHPLFRVFYKKQPDLFHVHNKDFFLAVNPVFSASVSSETYKSGDISESQTLVSGSRGLEFRGWISKKIGFYAHVTDNQDQPLSYVRNWIEAREAVPGADYYKHETGKTYDYIQARGYINFAIVKDHLDMTLGRDKQFIGDGIRSLFLSDFSSNINFVRLNTRIWKINYQNLFMELTPQYARGADRNLPHKYASMHYLSINATRWLNIGLFESVIFGRTDRYEFGYLNPIIFYRAAERSNGSPDNSSIGLSFKAIVTSGVQLYGQLYLDEFKSKELFSNRKWWGNKYGVQFGVKYFNALNIKNLDLQAEVNAVRPYTYAHSDTIANYTNYNQPLAHPLGSGFVELIGAATYQPWPRTGFRLNGMYYVKGVDTGGLNYGNDVFTTYNTYATEYGVKMVNGLKSNCLLLRAGITHQLRDRLFLEAGCMYRKLSFDNDFYPAATSFSTYFSIRLNVSATSNYVL